MIERPKRWWWKLTREPSERMAACGQQIGTLLDQVERSGHLCTVTGRKPKVVIRLVRDLTEIQQELLR